MLSVSVIKHLVSLPGSKIATAARSCIRSTKTSFSTKKVSVTETNNWCCHMVATAHCLFFTSLQRAVSKLKSYFQALFARLT